MADLTNANVRLVKEWVEGELHGKRRLAKRVEVHGVTVGGETNKIVATAFGMRVIEEVSPGYNGTTGRAVGAAPIADGSSVYLYTALDNSTAAADVTMAATPGGHYFVVKGYL